MSVRTCPAALVAALLLAGAIAAPPGSASTGGSAGPWRAPSAVADGSPTVYVGSLDAAALGALVASGVDRDEITATRSATPGETQVEVVLDPATAAALVAHGVPLSEKQVDGTPASTLLAAPAAPAVFRRYSGAGGLLEEYRAIAAAHPDIARLERIGTTVKGRPIVALRLTGNVAGTPDGSRPSSLFVAAQHAREWITPEMNRRLAHYVAEGYGSVPAVTRILDQSEVWIVPVANPDGYDYTFSAGHRLWRKNLRDNNGDGKITGVDGVDPNRNFPDHWGYDNEGSSPNPGSETYRGSGPASEPETQALDGLMARIGPEFLVNYHSAAELLLYGQGWQVSTDSPDDQVAIAMAGDDAQPAVPGYDPDVAADLYTTNGETDDRAIASYKTVAFTPEMSTCETASAVDPDDAFDPEDCLSVFTFPDSEPLIEAEFEKNLPFALSVAGSATDPDDPVSSVGRTAPDFVVDSFTTSYGSPQPVQVTARRALRDLTMHYSIAGGPTRSVPTRVWSGGERYGRAGDRWYADYRARVRGARPGQRVEVWFSGSRRGPGQTQATLRTSEHFTYRLASDSGADVLVLADEDYDGVNPTYPSSVTSPKYAKAYRAALTEAGLSSAVWDVSAKGVPSDLGVLSHFDAVVWYLGDNRLTQDPEDEELDFFGDLLEDAQVAERAQYLTLAVRDYLNEGGKLVHTGETAAYFGQLGAALGGIYYGLDNDPTQECVVTVDPYSDCLLLADDFAQYYLGASSRTTVAEPPRVVGTAAPFAGLLAGFGGTAVADNPLDEAGAFTPTSELLPPAQFPQFRSRAATAYQGAAGGAFDPLEGTWYAGALGADDTWTRLARTVDLTSTTAGQDPTLRLGLSYDLEPDYDHVVVEAHTVGQDDWTTLAEAGGLFTEDLPAECEAGFLVEEHPFLEHYLTFDEDGCTDTGTTGAWHAGTGSSDGWQQAAFDLSAYAGKRVEVVVSEITDPSSHGAGVFVDQTRLSIGGSEVQPEGFETGLGAWSVQPAPAGSPPATIPFARRQSAFASGIATADTVLLGFGVEQLRTRAERADVLGRALFSLLR